MLEALGPIGATGRPKDPLKSNSLVSSTKVLAYRSDPIPEYPAILARPVRPAWRRPPCSASRRPRPGRRRAGRGEVHRRYPHRGTRAGGDDVPGRRLLLVGGSTCLEESEDLLCPPDVAGTDPTELGRIEHGEDLVDPSVPQVESQELLLAADL